MAADLAAVVGNQLEGIPTFDSQYEISVNQANIPSVTFDCSPITLLRAVNAAIDPSRFAIRTSSFEDATAPTFVDARNSTDSSIDVALAATSISNNSVVASEASDNPEDWWLPVSDTPSITVDLEVVDANGDIVTSVAVGEKFTLNIYAQDLTQDANGVFTAFMDISFDPRLANATGELQHSPGFQNFKSGKVVAPGKVDNIGGGPTNPLDKTGTERLLIASLTFLATSQGELTIQSSTAGVYPAYDMLLYGKNLAIHPRSVEFGSVIIHVRAKPETSVDAPVDSGVLDRSDQEESGLPNARRAMRVVGDAASTFAYRANDDYFAQLPASDTAPSRPFTPLDESLESEFSPLAEALSGLWQSQRI